MDSLKTIAKGAATIAFIADLITVAIFVNELLFGDILASIDAVAAQVITVTAIFIFAVMLLRYSDQELRSLDRIIFIFSWLYILFGALILFRVSFVFIIYANYSFNELMAYGTLTTLIIGLGFITAMNIQRDTRYFSVPFMLIALFQIALWLWRMLTDRLVFDAYFVSNILLLAYVGALVILFLRSQPWGAR